ncbi:MAG: four helix bundle protein [Thermodesulfobacteriota bacterium]
MRIDRFEDLDSWKEARALDKEVYGGLAACHDRGFREQIQRAAVSVMANIAEGFARATPKECIHFFTIARGSTAEVKSLCYLALDLGYLNGDSFAPLTERCDKIKALIADSYGT